MKLRVGLVGLGDAWESRHRGALRSLTDRFEVRAVCTEVAKRAEQVAGEFNAIPVDGFRALASRSDVDAVLLLASDWFGSLPILAACDQGKAVYCAAPVETNIEKAKYVKGRVEESGIAFMAEFPRRHAAATLRLKELIATRLGPPKLLFCHARCPVPAPGGNGHKAPDQTAVRLREMVDQVDWCRYVVGDEPTSVLGVQHQVSHLSEQEDYEMMSLNFSSDTQGEGALAQISCGHYLPARWQEAITFRPPAALQISCERGIAFVDLPSTLIWFDDAGRHLESLESERPVGEQLLNQFHRAVTSLVRRSGDLEDVYRALQIVLTARRSSQSGKREALRNVERRTSNAER
jgi:predicted dehydrogenase